MRREGWQEATMREVKAECDACDPLAVLNIRGFVSSSKGRGRKRRTVQEVILVNCPATEGRTFHTLNRAPLDLFVVDLWPRDSVAQIDKRNYLRTEIERRVHAKR